MARLTFADANSDYADTEDTAVLVSGNWEDGKIAFINEESKDEDNIVKAFRYHERVESDMKYHGNLPAANIAARIKDLVWGYIIDNDYQL